MTTPTPLPARVGASSRTCAPAEYQETSSFAADNDAGSGAQALPPDLAFARKPRGAVQCRPAAQDPEARSPTTTAPASAPL
jgi:hypothetical protein